MLISRLFIISLINHVSLNLFHYIIHYDIKNVRFYYKSIVKFSVIR